MPHAPERHLLVYLIVKDALRELGSEPLSRLGEIPAGAEAALGGQAAFFEKSSDWEWDGLNEKLRKAGMKQIRKRRR